MEAEVEAAILKINTLSLSLVIPLDQTRTERYITEHFSYPPEKVIQPRTVNPVPIPNNSEDRTVPVIHEHSVVLDHDNKFSSQLTYFLLKKDLLLTRFSTSDKKPEHFSA